MLLLPMKLPIAIPMTVEADGPQIEDGLSTTFVQRIPACSMRSFTR